MSACRCSGACVPQLNAPITLTGCGPISLCIPAAAEYTVTITNPLCNPLVCPPNGWANDWMQVDQPVFHAQDFGYVWEPTEETVDWGAL